MLEKDVIGENVINNLGLEQERSKVDPRLKMQLRHKQVGNIKCSVSIYFKTLNYCHNNILI